MSMSCRDYKLTRRSMMGATSASILGLSVKDLLANAGKSHTPTAEHVIFFWCGGGISHIDTWDPKPGRETQGEFEPIATSVPGIQISEIFPSVARQMHHAALIRSIAGTQGAHGRATYNVQTGYLPAGNLLHPGVGSSIVNQLDRIGDLPSYISISGRAPKAGFLGQKCEAYFVASPGDKDPYLAFPEGIGKVRGNRRLEILSKFNNRFETKNPDVRLASTQSSIDDAVALMRSPALKAFEFEDVASGDLSRYGDTAFGRGALLAKRLVETGVRFVQVNRGGFDTHSNNFEAMSNHGSVMDPALGSLIEDLAQTGKLDKTLILMIGEFGRTPRINDNVGRDHWPNVFSCFMAGGGIHGGAVVGSSDKDGAYPNERPVRVPDLHATICQALGIDHQLEVMTPLQRPIKIVDDGEPVRELFI